MKKAIVSGANGFVGTALCKILAYAGIKVIAIIRDETEDISQIESLENIHIVYADLSAFKALPEQIRERDIDVFYHLAWVGSAGPLRGDSDVQIDNVRYTCDAVRACRQLGCRRFVFASSIMEYEVEAMMNSETAPGISSLYSSAKIAADYMARIVANHLEVDYIRAVISNIYGPGEKSPRLINTSLRKLLNGEHCAFSAGEQMYDFIYIDDAAKTFLAIGEKGVSNRTYYIGSQHPQRLKDFLIEMKEQVDPEIQIGLGELPFNGISLSYNEFDINAVKRDTGFVPEISFSEGIRRTIQWIKG